MLTKEDYIRFTLEIQDGYFYWQIILNDNKTYQIKVRVEKHITPRGNQSKRKIYFIRVNEKELIFDEEMKKRFKAFRYPYIRCGI